MKRFATANWKGAKEGTGSLTTQSNLISNLPYTFHSRFEDGKESNPEELIAAAHSGCFSMKLSILLGNAGFPPDNINTRCDITIEAGTITTSHLTVKGNVPGITPEKFEEIVKEARMTCPVSKLLNCEITHEAQLEQVTA